MPDSFTREDLPERASGPDPEVWLRLEKDADGRPLPTQANVQIILEHDPRWAETLRHNLLTNWIEFDGKPFMPYSRPNRAARRRKAGR